MNDAEWVRAPRWRITSAGLIDAAVAAAAVASMRGRLDLGRAGRLVAGLLAPTGELVREQLGSPGQRLLGIRTVDRRTGERVALRRTALLLLAAAAGQALTARLAAPAVTAEDERANRALAAELQEIRARSGDPASERAEILALYERHRRPFGRQLSRAVAPMLAVGLINRRLRRHLAPTRQVLVRRRDDHKP